MVYFSLELSMHGAVYNATLVLSHMLENIIATHKTPVLNLIRYSLVVI